eukprot:TRINITY_DN4143_c0_g1_i5.p1 TRINITY_DN4143_c0_g1~~TRINITY_DN4143_c0_g1_i5.p1  ORF type:complete len:306 (-),score=31.72 TRINITY_DN4143_c0_g1_i5:700-1617(-)
MFDRFLAHLFFSFQAISLFTKRNFNSKMNKRQNSNLVPVISNCSQQATKPIYPTSCKYLYKVPFTNCSKVLNSQLIKELLFPLKYFRQDFARSGSILIDPLCGSGTILLEAALIAKNEAPGSYRLTWPFMRWADFDQQLWKDSLEQAWANKKMFNGQIIGLDRDENRIRYAKFCRAEARAKKVMELNVAYLESWVMRQKPDFVITNPPWGMQMLRVDQSMTDEELQQQEQELEFVWKTLGKFLKEQCQGSQASVYCGRPDLLNHLGLKSKQTQVIQAGGMSTRLDLFDVPIVEELAPTQEVASIA